MPARLPGKNLLQGRTEMLGLLPWKASPERSHEYDGRAGQHQGGVESQACRTYTCDRPVKARYRFAGCQTDPDVTGHLFGQTIPVEVFGEVRRNFPNPFARDSQSSHLGSAVRTTCNVPANAPSVPEPQISTGKKRQLNFIGVLHDGF